MRKRCLNPDCKSYPQYGGRGIGICEEWSEFEAFYQWALAGGYTDELTLDRRDNRLGYSPENCRWATSQEQNRNRQDNIRFPWGGEMLLIPEIASRERVSEKMIRQRINRGWDIERAVHQPSQR